MATEIPTNSSNCFESSSFNLSHCSHVILPQIVFDICLWSTFTIGVPANISIIYLIVTVKQLRNISNLILSIICIADLASFLVIVPVQLHPSLLHTGLFLNNAIIASQVFICSISILSLTALSYDRHNAVTRPLTAKQTLKANVITILFIIVLSCLVAFPFLFYLRRDGPCDFHILHLKFIIPMTFVLLYVLPLTAISLFYVRMACKLSSSRKTVQESLKRNKRIKQQRNRVAMTVLCLVVLFAICWAPFYIDLFYFISSDGSSVCASSFQMFIRNWKTVFLLANPFFDPLSIYMLGSKYRWHLRHTFLGRKICGVFSRDDGRHPSDSVTDTQMKSMPTGTSTYFKPLYNTKDTE